MSFHHRKTHKIKLISSLSKQIRRRRADNGLHWKERNSNAWLYVLAFVSVFAGTIGIWLLLSSIATG